jgi:hypothetical protein
MSLMGTIDWFEGWSPPGGSHGKAVSDIAASATQVRCSRPIICDAGIDDDDPESFILYTTEDRDEIAALAAALRTEPPSDSMEHCMCVGTLVFDFEGPRPLVATLHHGENLRWGGADGDLALLDPGAVMDWLSARGMGFVREEYEADRRSTEEIEARMRRWRAALPASMVPFFEERWTSAEDEDYDDYWSRLTAAIETELPDPIERARALLDLFGNEADWWSMVTLYEMEAERLLLGFPLAVLLAAIGDAPDERRREGAARLFSSVQFGRDRAADRAELPEPLRRLLLAHVEASPDQDKRLKAHAALGRR